MRQDDPRSTPTGTPRDTAEPAHALSSAETTGASETTGQDALPAAPPGWEDAPEPLLRIAAPGGRVVAWVCPAIGANTLAYAVRLGGRWVQVLDVPAPAALREAPSRFGLPVLFPFPGHMRDRRYSWAGQERIVPPTYPGGSGVVHGFAHVRPWRTVEHGPSRVVCELRTPDDLDAEQAASYPFQVRVTLTVEIDGASGRLVVGLVARNEGAAPAPVALGLHPYFGADVLGADRTRVRVMLPGRSERVLTATPPPIPTGERRPAPPEPVAVVPLGERMLVARTAFGGTAAARLAGLAPLDGRPGWTVELEMSPAYRDVLLFAPSEHNSVSIEPHTHAPGAASMPEGDPNGLVGLAPGATLAATATLRLVPPA